MNHFDLPTLDGYICVALFAGSSSKRLRLSLYFQGEGGGRDQSGGRDLVQPSKTLARAVWEPAADHLTVQTRFVLVCFSYYQCLGERLVEPRSVLCVSGRPFWVRLKGAQYSR